MEWFSQLLETDLLYAALIFLRVSGIILSSPIFGRQNIPSSVKIAYCMALTYFFLTSTPQLKPVIADSIPVFALMCAKELLFGLIMGYLLTMFFSMTFIAGQMVDMQMGFGMANVYDTQSNVSVPITGNLFNIMTLLCFYAVNGHNQLLYLMYATIWKIPVGAVVLPTDVGLTILQLFCQMFVLAVRMTMPMIIAGLMGEVVLGVLVRTVPQMNIFNVGMPLKVIIGFIALLVILPFYVNFTNVMFEELFKGIESVFSGMG